MSALIQPSFQKKELSKWTYQKSTNFPPFVLLSQYHHHHSLPLRLEVGKAIKSTKKRGSGDFRKMALSGLLVWIGGLLLLHALVTAVQHHAVHTDNHPFIVAEAILGFILATFAYIHKVGRFDPIDKKVSEKRTLESFTFSPDFMAFNHRGQVWISPSFISIFSLLSFKQAPA